jgi:hypothetical protein
MTTISATTTSDATPYLVANRDYRTTRCICGGVRAPSKPRTHTYLMQRERWVKIGQARSIAVRMRQLAQPGAVICPADMDEMKPIELRWSAPVDVEHQLHRAYASHHVAGEWFFAVPVIRDLAPYVIGITGFLDAAEMLA